MLLEALKYDNRIFGLDPQLVFQVAFQMLAIFILFLAASYLLLDPVRKILNDRKERVMKEQKEAKESREQAIRFKDEYDTKLKRIDKEAEQILSDARKKAMQRRMRLSQTHERRQPVSWRMQRVRQSLRRSVLKMK